MSDLFQLRRPQTQAARALLFLVFLENDALGADKDFFGDFTEKFWCDTFA